MGKIGRFWAKIKFLVKKLLKNLVVIKIMPTFALAIEKQHQSVVKDALVAQLVEHLTLNQRVQGSSPCRRTKRHFRVSLFFVCSY